MGKELEMAWSKETKQSIRRESKPSSMLLARSRSRVSTTASSRGNKRKKTTTANSKGKDREVKDIKTKSKISPETENTDGDTIRKPKRGRPRRDNKDRKPDRRIEGKNSNGRRSASELGIEWIGSYCPDGRPHHLVGIHNLYGGSLFKCSNCSKHVWLPICIRDAAQLDSLIDSYGTTTGYRKYLDTNRDAKVLVAKLQDLWYLRQQTDSDDKEFAGVVVKIMEDKEYDKKEE